MNKTLLFNHRDPKGMNFHLITAGQDPDGLAWVNEITVRKYPVIDYFPRIRTLL